MGEVASFAGDRLTSTEGCLSLSPEEAARGFWISGGLVYNKLYAITKW